MKLSVCVEPVDKIKSIDVIPLFTLVVHICFLKNVVQSSQSGVVAVLSNVLPNAIIKQVMLLHSHIKLTCLLCYKHCDNLRIQHTIILCNIVISSALY